MLSWGVGGWGLGAGGTFLYPADVAGPRVPELSSGIYYRHPAIYLAIGMICHGQPCRKSKDFKRKRRGFQLRGQVETLLLLKIVSSTA